MTFRRLNELGLPGTKYGTCLIYATEPMPISLFLLVVFMWAMLHELYKAALIDGCGVLDLLWRVILPFSHLGRSGTII